MSGGVIGAAIRKIRKSTTRGIINMNTNGSLPKVISALFDAGLDSVRISMNSAREKYYTRYYKPNGYTFAHVLRSIEAAKSKGAFVSINYLTMPGFTDSLSPERSKALRVWLADLLMSFRAARRHPWLRESLDHLEGFRTERGTYLFPRSYLQERTQGMWINGHRMGLEENRRRSLALELESTFWMARLRRALSAPSRVDASR